METNNLHVHIESQQDHSFWYGSFIEFARANSLTPGQMFSICEELELTGKVEVSGCGSACYTLRSGNPPRRPQAPRLRTTVRRYLHRGATLGSGWNVKH